MKNGKGKSPARMPEDVAATYNAFKEFEGQRYTGMKIGRSHKWHYDPGDWKETKLTPDEWKIEYSVTKRRAGHAPEGSGVPVGTSYHWYILAHQNVTKLNANDYSTSMVGVKYKLAHRRAESEKWSASDAAQRRRLVAFLREIASELEAQAGAAGEPPVPAKAKPRPAKRPAKPAAARGRANRVA